MKHVEVVAAIIRTQDDIPQLISKSPRLDIVAEDAEGTLYEIEVQRLEEPAPARRVRYYTSVMDSELLRKDVGYDKLPEVYLFYISEKDIWCNGPTMTSFARSTDIWSLSRMCVTSSPQTERSVSLTLAAESPI